MPSPHQIDSVEPKELAAGLLPHTGHDKAIGLKEGVTQPPSGSIHSLVPLKLETLKTTDVGKPKNDEGGMEQCIEIVDSEVERRGQTINPLGQEPAF